MNLPVLPPFEGGNIMANSLRKDISSLLTNPLFQGLSDKQLAEIAEVLDEVHCKSGTIIAMEGDPATELYFIKSGTAEVFKKEPELDHEHTCQHCQQATASVKWLFWITNRVRLLSGRFRIVAC